MNKINESMYDTRFPKNDLVNIKRKNEKDRKEFLNIYSLYNYWLNRYLYENTSIKEYEKILGKSKLNITPIEKEQKDIYQYMAQGITKYFYIRNNTYIERLLEEDIDFLKKRLLSKNTKYDLDAEILVKYTFKKIIREMKNVTFNKETINYGPNNNIKFYASSETIVIGARFNYYMEKIETEEEEQLYMNRIAFFREKCKELESKLCDELDCDVKVIIYDELSTKKIIENFKK